LHFGEFKSNSSRRLPGDLDVFEDAVYRAAEI